MKHATLPSPKESPETAASHRVFIKHTPCSGRWTLPVEEDICEGATLLNIAPEKVARLSGGKRQENHFNLSLLDRFSDIVETDEASSVCHTDSHSTYTPRYLRHGPQQQLGEPIVERLPIIAKSITRKLTTETDFADMIPAISWRSRIG